MNASRIIKGVVGGGRYTVTAPIIKEDYGLYLKIEGFDLPTSYEVDFSNDEHNGSSITMIGNADGVLIPSQFISSGKDVFAFLYHVGVDFGRTVYKFRIPNKLRPDRTDETPTPEEQSTIDQAISALNSAVEQTAQDVISADQSARSAESAKTAAESARDTAGGYANDAQSSAESASESARVASEKATASAQSASQSAQIKADVEDLVDDARSYAESALIASQASVTARDTAQGYALSASASAQSASGYASNAQTSANTASSKATEASTSAQTASAKATEAAQSASQALSYKTDAESAKTASQTAQGLAESARDLAQGYAEDAQGYANDAQASAESISASASQIAQNTADIASLEEDRYKPYVVDTASGAIASFTDGADGLPLKSLVVDINPVQDLHGQDSPYPAGGGKNLLKNNLASQKKNGITVSVDSQGIITLTGTATVQTQFDINTDIGIGAGNYILSGISDGSSTTLKLEAKVDGSWDVNLFNGERSLSVATGIEQLVIIVYNGASLSNVQIKPMIRLSTVTDATFAPYENICPISGWTQVDVEQSGVNLYSFDENKITTGNVTASTIRAYYPLGIKGCTLSFSAYQIDSSQTTDTYINVGKLKNETLEIINALISPNGVFNRTFTFSDDEEAVLMAATTSPLLLKNNLLKYRIQVEKNGSVSEYSPYTGRSITIDLGQTVYGGKLDVLSGELTIDRAMVDLATVRWSSYDGTSKRWSTQIQAMKSTTARSDKLWSDRWRTSKQATAGDEGVIFGYLNYVYFYTSDTNNTPIGQLMYELATPLEIQLTPNQINSLYGVNNIFADTGDTACEYRADTELWVQRKITEAVAAVLNS